MCTSGYAKCLTGRNNDGEQHDLAILRSRLIYGLRLRPTPTASILTSMTLKNAALLALVGTILMTILLVWNFIFTLLNVLRDLVPAVTLFSSLIYAFGWFSVMVFFFVFHRAQR
jgi:hypothetical protein